jgi:hypothetical protein
MARCFSCNTGALAAQPNKRLCLPVFSSLRCRRRLAGEQLKGGKPAKGREAQPADMQI